MPADSYRPPVNSPWLPQRPSTPLATQPYTVQKVFRIVGSESELYNSLDRESDIRPLQEAIVIARRTCASPRGERITNIALSVRGDHARPVGHPHPAPLRLDLEDARLDPTILQNQRMWFAKDMMEVVVNTATREYGFVDPDKPKEINIRADLVLAARMAYNLMEANLSTYHAHVFHLAVVISHEIQHCLRASGAGILFNTPPSVSDGKNRRKEEVMGRVVEHAEGGWAFEASMYGGELAAAVYTENELGATYPNKIKTIFVQKIGPPCLQWLEVPAADIKAIVIGEIGWEMYLPFTTDRCRSFLGVNDRPRLRDVSPQQAGHKRAVSPSASDQFRPTHSSCGYRGFENEVRRGV